MPQYNEQESRVAQFDFSQGIVGKISETGLPVSARRFGRRPYIRMVRKADNAIFKPRRAVGIRQGTHDVSAAALLEPPHSLAKFYAIGGNRVFAFTDSGSSNGKAWEETSSAYTQYTAPYSLTSQWVTHVMMNNVLILTQNSGTQPPFFWGTTNPATTFLTCKLPKPTVTPTFNANTTGGSQVEDASRGYYYRVRWKYNNGASLAGPVSAKQIMVVGSGNDTAQIKNVADALVPSSQRADWIGWTLERTWINGDPVLGPFRTVYDGTATGWGPSNTAFVAGCVPDGLADSALFNAVDDTQYGEPPHMDGIVEYRGRLFGWSGSSLYYSQNIVNNFSYGLFNFVGNALIQVGSNDGDGIQSCIVQSGRLIIGKSRSIWSLEGDDPTNFRLSLRYVGAGFAGPRAACAIGNDVFFHAGSGRMFVMRGNAVQPFLVDEAGEYFDGMDTSQDAKIVVRNYNGEYVVVWYRATPDTLGNGDCLAFHLHEKNLTHWKGVYASDILVQKDTTEVLFADPVLRQPVNVSGFATNPAFLIWNQGTTTRALGINNADGSVKSGWTAGGTTVGASTGNAAYDALCGDGSGNLFALTIEPRAGVSYGIYVQKFNASGAAQWTAGGVSIIALSDAVTRSAPAICADGAGGCILTWTDRRTASTPRVYAQRLDGTGAPLWTANGVHVDAGVDFGDDNSAPFADGAGGCYVAWLHNSSVSNIIYTHAQRLLSTTGAPQWGSVGGAGGGTRVASNPGSVNPTSSVCRDGLGNILVGWLTAGNNVVVTKIPNTGVAAWTSAGLIGSTGVPNGIKLCPDGLGGAFACWNAWAPTTTVEVLYANAVNSSGAIRGTNPVQISAVAPTGQQGVWSTQYAIVSDGAGGCGFVFFYVPAASTYQIVAQRINNSLVTQWGAGGVLLGTTTGLGNVSACTDGAGGLIGLWPFQGTPAIMAQRVNANGLPLWTSGGVTLETAGTSRFSGAQGSNLVFTDTPQGEYVPGAGAGYHIWAGLNGTRDQRALDATGGIPINWMIQTHPIDDATPDSWKAFDRFEADVSSGTGVMAVTLDFGTGIAPVTLQLSANFSSLLYNNGLTYNSGLTYPLQDLSVLFSGLPLGTISRRFTMHAATSVTADMVFAGYALNYFILPRRDHSSL